MNIKNTKSLLALVAFFLPFSLAYADGIIANPLQVELSAKQRGASVKLSNITNEDKLLRISFKEPQMQLNGKLVNGEPGRWAASPLIRFSPRQILVPAGSSQTVRLLYRRRVGMADGEYRSHLTFQEIPLPGEKVTADKAGVALSNVSGFSIPAYVKHGKVNGSLKLNSVGWKPGTTPVLKVALAREGNASVYGRLEVISGTPEQPRASLFRSRKFAVYRELQQRLMEVNLPAGISPGEPVFVQVWTLSDGNNAPITLAVNR